MALFPKEQEASVPMAGGAPGRMAWTREQGTRKVLFGFLALLLVWFLYGKVSDHFLLQTQWPPLQPDPLGLTIVGTLDARGDYDRNMFKVVQANKSSRVELTDFGWRSIFKDGGSLANDRTGEAIRQAISVDSDTGYAMLGPFLRAGVASLMGRPGAPDSLKESTVIPVHAREGGVETAQERTLGALIAKYSSDARGGAADMGEEGGIGSGSSQEVEHGLTIPGDVLIKACPIVLTGAHFTEAEVEEHPATIFQGKTFTVHLGLTPEGRSRFFQWSHDHINEDLVFVLRDQVIAAGRVTQILNINNWEIGPLRDAEAARLLASFVNGRK
jgi:hypothetical protein